MGTIIKRSGVVLLAALLIIAVGGFPVFTHYCACSEASKASLFIEVSECSEQEAIQADACCNIQKETSCCTTPVKEKHHCNKNDCCSTTAKFIKITHDFNSPLIEVSLKFVAAYVAVLHDEINFNRENTAYRVRVSNYEHPPPDFGRALLLSLQQTRISPEHA